MKINRKIIFFSIILGLFVWFADAILDYMFFYEKPFLGVLISDLSSFELYIRSAWLAFFLLFGVIMSKVILKRKFVEETLRESEERYRSLVELSPDAICVQSGGEITFINTTGAKLFGTQPEQMIGKPLIDFVHPDYHEVEKERILQVIEERKKVPPIEEKFCRLDGTVYDVEVTAAPVIYKDKRAVQVIIRDITERKRAEKELRERDCSYRTLSENLPGIVYRIFLKDNNRMQFLNDMVQPMTGFTIEELTTGNTSSLFHLILPEDRAHVVKTVKRAVMENMPFKVEYRIRDKKGNIRYFIGRGRPISEAEGGPPVYIDGVIFDVTETKQAEEQIKEQAALLDKAHDAVIVLDMENCIIYFNKKAGHLYGLTAKESINKKINELMRHDEEGSLKLIEAQEIVMEKKEWSGELCQLTQDGKKIIVESRWALLHDGGGIPRSILVINTDITEKKKLERQFLRAQRMESIGTLASGIAHDINNVLSPIMLSLELLKEKFTDDESQKLFTILERSTERGASLIKQVQLFAQGIEGERIVLQIEHFITEIRQMAKETFPRSIEIRTDMQKDLWTVSGDATQLHQVLMNLCVNARDAMPDGGILSISAENLFIDGDFARMNIEAKVGPYIVITVTDTGVGIHSDIQDRIFEPFFTTKKHGKGTGLGLSTALGIVKSHGGFMNVYSKVGKGTAFQVYLPAIITLETKKAEECQNELPEGHDELILVVDDEAHIRDITRKTLEKYGYRVITADDGNEAISLYLQYRDEIKVVLMDMMMPVMDGKKSIRTLRNIRPDIKIIGVSGLTEKDKLTKFQGTHVHAFLQKPYSAEKLLRTIHEVILCNRGVA